MAMRRESFVVTLAMPNHEIRIVSMIVKKLLIQRNFRVMYVMRKEV